MVARDQVTIQPPPLHDAQKEILANQARFKVVAAGRRFGKGHLCAWLAVEEASQGGRVWWVAPSYKISLIGWSIIKRLVKQLPGVRILESTFTAYFPGEGWIQIRSADDPQSLRGEGLTLAILDEAAFMNEVAWKEAIRPALSDFQGRAVFISTPNGRNWFYNLWMMGQNPSYPDWQSFQYPTLANPYIKEEEVNSARRELPSDVFKQEYLAQFLASGGIVFKNLGKALYPAFQMAQYQPRLDRLYVAGVDWGQIADFTVITIIDSDKKEVVAVERFNQIGWEVQRSRVAALLDHWGVSFAYVEENSIGGPNLEVLSREGLPVVGFVTSNQSKARIIQQLASDIERGKIRIPAIDWLRQELESYEATRLPSGLWRYSAPQGGHDDGVISLALANKAKEDFTGAYMAFAETKW